MRLRSARIQNFRCVEDSTEFSVDDVTCLVGKNESGKTAVLQALYRLNPVVAGDAAFNDVVDYPRRHWSKYKDSKEEGPAAQVLTTTWVLDKGDVDVVAKAIGPDGLKSTDVGVEKGYDNVRRWSIRLDERAIVKHLIGKSGLHAEEIGELTHAKSVEALLTSLRAVNPSSDRHQSLIKEIEGTFPDGSAVHGVLRILDARLPRFVYFADYHRLPGQVALDDLQRRAGNPTIVDQVFHALLDLAGTDLKELIKVGKFEEFIAELEAVSNRITDTIFRYWSQNQHLEVDFRLDAARPQDPAPLNSGYIFRTRIRNSRHRVTVGFDERSTGFVWFFSFLVWFSQLNKKYGENLFILLDEPGLSLHARAQQDLLRYINECLKPVCQVMYSTHSPFMIDPESILSVRTVEDVVRHGNAEGTKIGDEVLSTDADTLFPLQAALGYEITQTLFVGKHILLVEGPSDLLYLKWFSWELESRGRVSLDRRWVVTPCGGIDKVGSFLALFGANHLDVAVLTDFHEGDKKKIRSLREMTVLKGGRVFSAEMYAGQGEADIEDMMGRSFYAHLVNDCYGLEEKLRLPKKPKADAPCRVVEEITQHFATLPANAPEYDHYAPATFLTESGGKIRSELPGLDEALDRFERLFRDVNSLLAKQSDLTKAGA